MAKAERMCAQAIQVWNRRFAGWMLLNGMAYLMAVIFDPSWSLCFSAILTMALWVQLRIVTVANEALARSNDALDAICECQAQLLELDDHDA